MNERRSQSVAVMADMVLVPREPTVAMIAAYWDCIERNAAGGTLLSKAADRYKALIAAAPGAATLMPPVQEPAEPLCACKDRPVSQCDEEWGSKCDLGNNAAHARVHIEAPKAAPQAVVGEASEQVILELAKDYAKLIREEAWHSACVVFDQLRDAVRALTPSPAPTAVPQEADALREALEAARKHIEFMRSTETSVRAIELQSETLSTIEAALAQHQAPQQEVQR